LKKRQEVKKYLKKYLEDNYGIHYLCHMKSIREKEQLAKKYEKETGIRVVVKSVTPTIVSYEVLHSEFTDEFRFKPAFGPQGAFFNHELDAEHKLVLQTLEKHKSALAEIEDVTLKFLIAAIKINPPVYIARTRDIKTDIEYFVAKTFIPTKGGKKKEIKVYLGKASDYDNDTKHNEARVKGKRLLRKALQEKLDLE
jgi:hypothetical protein